MAVSIHGNNGVVTTNGTAAAPSFAAPDTDTGLYFGTNLIHATTNGVNRFNIDATGKVGIGGATSPEELLDLGNALQINLKVGGRAYLGQGYSTAATILGHSVKAKTTGTVSGGMEVTETNSGGGAPAAMRMQSGTIEFHTATSGTSGATFDSEKLRIDSTGRILVNRQSQHASSAERLSVNGMTSIQFNSTSSAGLYIYNEDTTGSGAIQPHIFCHDGSGIRTGLGIQRSTGLTIFNGQFGISFRTGASSVGGTERLNIQSDGKSNFTNDVRIVKTGGALLEVTTNTGAADAILRLSEGATGSTTNGGGMFYSGADNKLYITCGTNSTTKRVTINRDDGHVGINTTAPDAMLQVDYDFANSKVGLRLRAASGSGTKTWQLSEINGTPAVLTIRNATNGYNILNIDGANQRVGINKTDPDGKGIDVAHGRTNTYSGTQDHRGLAHIIARNTSDAPDRFASISIVSGGSTQAEGSINLVQTANYTGDLTFKLRYGATSWAERLRITSSGHIYFPNNGQDVAWGASQQFKMYWENTEDRMYLQGNGAYGVVFRINGGNRIEIDKTTGDVTMQGASGRNFQWDNSEPSLYLTDNGSNSARLKVGSGGDLQMYHDVGPHMNHITCATNADLKVSTKTLQVYEYTGVHKKFEVTNRGKILNYHQDTSEYGASDWARTGSGNQGNASQAHPEGSLQFQSNTGYGTMRYKSYIQSTDPDESNMYITLYNSGFYRITIKASHNSQSANVAMYLVYGLNNMSARIEEVTNSGNFSATTQNTHVNSHDTTLKISYSGGLNQGMRALVETIGGF